MKTKVRLTIVTILAFMILSCISKNNETKDKPEKQLENFDWLLGKWKRLHEETGKETFENWKKINQSEYVGIGFTIQNSDTIRQEKMRIVKQSGTWVLTVKVPEEPKSIDFHVIELSTNEFICKNDSLNFPKEIKYWKNGEKINALIVGDSFKIEFEFERMK